MKLGRAGERVRSAERDPGGGLLIQSGIHPSPLLIPLSLLGAHWGPSPTPDASRLGLGPNERERATRSSRSTLDLVTTTAHPLSW